MAPETADAIKGNTLETRYYLVRALVSFDFCSLNRRTIVGKHRNKFDLTITERKLRLNCPRVPEQYF